MTYENFYVNLNLSKNQSRIKLPYIIQFLIFQKNYDIIFRHFDRKNVSWVCILIGKER